jgi:hypothetical protein
MLDLSLLIEEVILENIFRDKLYSIYNKTLEAKKIYDKNKNIFKNSKEDLKQNLSNFVLKRIELRYELADLVKNKPVLLKGKIVKTEQDLDQYISDKDIDLKDLIILSSRLLPNSQSFTGPL